LFYFKILFLLDYFLINIDLIVLFLFIGEEIIMMLGISVNNRLMQVLSVAMSPQINFSLKSPRTELTSEWFEAGVLS